MTKPAALALFAAVLAGCATTHEGYSPSAEASLRTKVETIFRDLNEMKFDAMRARTDIPELSVFDFDPENKPLDAYSGAEWNRVVDQYADMVKRGGALRTELKRIDVHASESFGYATVEFDQFFSMGGQTMGPFKFRGTMIVRREGEDWVWTHWHGSMRELPPAEKK